MKMLLLLVVLAVAQHLLRPQAEVAGQAALKQRFPEAVHSLLLGGLQPLAVQILWWQLESAYWRGEFIEVMKTLRLLEQADPGNPRVATHLARFLAYDIAPREPNPEAQLARTMEAVEILDRAFGRLEDPHLALLQGLILRGPWSGDPALRAAFLRRDGRTPTEAAVLAYRSALAVAPGAPVVRIVLADALREEGVLELLEGRFVAGHERLAEARMIIESVVSADTGVLPGLIGSFEEIASALVKRDPKAAALAVDRLAEVIRRLPIREGGELLGADGFAGSVLRPVLDLGLETAKRAAPADVLSLLLATHRMRALLEERADEADGVRSVDPAIDATLRALGEEILLQAPELSDRVPVEPRAR